MKTTNTSSALAGLRPSVIIVGGGPTGLATALELGLRSISCLLIEREARGGHAPRAKTTHVRTRELLRRWNLADALAQASPFGIDYPTNVHFVTRLNGYPLARFDNAMNGAPQRDERYSEHGQWIPQYKLESVLRERLLAVDCVTVANGCEFVSFEQDDMAVQVTVKAVDTGEEHVIEADYLVGADGARSTVRDAIGAQMEGRYGLSRNYNIIFSAPGLADAHRHGPGIMYWQVNPDVPSVIGPMDQGDLWFFMPLGLPPEKMFTDQEALDLIKRSTGIDLPYQILSSDLWVASRLLADKYREGRVFLAGDACHLHPPYGGFGMNMGVADGVDLGWKIAAALQGWGGPALLDSYEAERRLIHEIVLDEAEGNHSTQPGTLFRNGIETEGAEGEAIRREVSDLIAQTKPREFYTLGIVLGLRYRRSPVIPDDGTEADWRLSLDYTPSAAPGSLAPHAWLADGSSLYDHFGAGFTLLAFGGVDTREAEVDAGKSGIPLKVVTIDESKVAALYEQRLVLIRPDQHVAWRGDIWPANDVLAYVAGLSSLSEDTAATKVSAE
ncbi:monooxygenase [Sphingobium sp. TA15]|uniref:Putative FAD-monooxygenase n=1 Tax=Sphingobium indicum (strain DSM 16413 / CCM 7287 / MTCC 6362 / UT26 / NBRC 101211 / UT26S) TaxID=452662 RepID=D4Z0Q7_SPHIU|nr:FAD-dependent monooxygenase [Sphingobium indicum]BAI96189.1 putative FAD-monooxygenase [Sphingobium indicum UT26S]BDD65491.1 monooxygenase [Sphingobium sp. TA15]